MKILLLASQHGNEPLGELLYEHIATHFDDLLPHIELTIGNPQAKQLGIRYLESDMNRSYDPSLSTHESLRAGIIYDQIVSNGYDLVLDLHTTVCVQPPCAIVSRLTDRNRAFLRASVIDRIVTIRHSIVDSSLIGVLPDVVSIEVSNDAITPLLLDSLAADMQRYIRNQVAQTTAKQYIVDELLLKSSITEADATKLRNFEMSPQGFIPILVGNNSYKKNTHYLGFKAAQETIITL